MTAAGSSETRPTPPAAHSPSGPSSNESVVEQPCRLVNLTTHAVDVATDAGLLRLDPEQEPARVQDLPDHELSLHTEHGSVLLRRLPRQASVTGLPDPQTDVLCVVSRVTAAASPRQDLVFPLDQPRGRDGTALPLAQSLGYFAPPESLRLKTASALRSVRYARGLTAAANFMWHGLRRRYRRSREWAARLSESWTAVLFAIATALVSAALGIIPDVVQENSQPGFEQHRYGPLAVFAVLGLLSGAAGAWLWHQRNRSRRLNGTAYLVREEALSWTAEQRASFLSEVRAHYLATVTVPGPGEFGQRWRWDLDESTREWDSKVDELVHNFWAVQFNDDQVTANGVFVWAWAPVAVAFAARVRAGRRGLDLALRPRPSFGRVAGTERVDWKLQPLTFLRPVPPLPPEQFETTVRLDVVTGPTVASTSPPVLVVLVRASPRDWGPLSPAWGAQPSVFDGSLVVEDHARLGLTSGDATFVELRYPGLEERVPWQEYEPFARGIVNAIARLHQQADHAGTTVLLGLQVPTELATGIGVLSSSRSDWPERVFPLVYRKPRAGGQHTFLVPGLRLGRDHARQAHTG